MRRALMAGVALLSIFSTAHASLMMQNLPSALPAYNAATQSLPPFSPSASPQPSTSATATPSSSYAVPSTSPTTTPSTSYAMPFVSMAILQSIEPTPIMEPPAEPTITAEHGMMEIPVISMPMMPSVEILPTETPAAPGSIIEIPVSNNGMVVMSTPTPQSIDIPFSGPSMVLTKSTVTTTTTPVPMSTMEAMMVSTPEPTGVPTTTAAAVAPADGMMLDIPVANNGMVVLNKPAPVTDAVPTMTATTCGSTCRYNFKGVQGVPIYSLTGRADSALTPSLGGSDLSTALEVGEAYANGRRISKLGLPPSTFALYPVDFNGHYGVGHRTLTAEQQARLAGACITLPVTHYVDNKGTEIVVVMTPMTDCVAFFV